MRIPPLETERLRIRPFVMDDLEAVYRLLDVELGNAEPDRKSSTLREERRRWLEWTVLGYEELSKLHQPPYGDLAIVLRGTGELIGACGFAPCLNAFDLIPALRPSSEPETGLNTPEVGLYWTISTAHQRRGYATEAARALIAYGFEQIHLMRLVATTDHDNLASQGVMRKLGMRVERNPRPEPPWLQAVGVLDHPGRTRAGD